MVNTMNWNKEIKELQVRIAKAMKMGGEQKVLRQHNAGRYTVRERINILVDKNTFREIGSLTGKG